MSLRKIQIDIRIEVIIGNNNISIFLIGIAALNDI